MLGLGESRANPVRLNGATLNVMVAHRVASLGACAAVLMLAGCDSNPSNVPVTPSARPEPPGPSLAFPSGTQTVLVTYSTRPETASLRGPCPVGYKVYPDPPGRFISCVYDDYSPSFIPARVGEQYTFSVGSLHCGLSAVQFDGRLWAADDLTGSRWAVAAGPDPLGTMTLSTSDNARFVSDTGDAVAFHAVSSIRLPLCE